MRSIKTKNHVIPTDYSYLRVCAKEYIQEKNQGNVIYVTNLSHTTQLLITIRYLCYVLQKPFKCDVCEKVFVMLLYSKVHEKVYIEEKSLHVI